MKNILPMIITNADRKEFREYIPTFFNQNKKFFLRNDILQLFRQYCDDTNKPSDYHETSSIFNFIKRIPELFVNGEYIAIMHRYTPAKYKFYLLRMDGDHMEEIALARYIDMKDMHVLDKGETDTHLHIDFKPFSDFLPDIRDSRTIGNGIRFLNRYLCSKFFNNPAKWNAKLFEFIKLHKYKEQQLLVNAAIIQDVNTFFSELDNVVEWLSKINPDTPYADVEGRMRRQGFELGWGNTAGRIVETMQVLIDLINEPTNTRLEEFIARIPMPLISKIAIISPHGWFGQTNVLGKPDTGGQVIYILDQVRALEKHLKRTIQLTGLNVEPKIIVLTRLIPDAGDTTCNQRKEKIFQTENGLILRIPFRDMNNQVVNHWISRFEIWPYLERYTEDAMTQLISEFEGRPDLIIGNYSDGNLVATLLSDKLDVIQCTIAHALEKTKYLFSDLYWKDREDDYHFSLQFTADMLAMNKADFIITSTHQEIIGTEDTMGQYESYQFFSLPGLYQVLNGVNLFAPKFNVIPPGVDEHLYFPFYEKEKRTINKTTQWKERLFYDAVSDIYGELENPDKIPVFTMARFDRIKNITGLIEAFGMSEILRNSCNLVFAAGTIHLHESHDAEERKEIQNAYALIDKYDLYKHVRWLPSINKLETGEVYRIIADHNGIFVQPALFEAFGLTIIEAMASGLPTFGPKFGGPLEIIEHGTSGYLLNTSKPELISVSLEAFIENCRHDPDEWKRISKNGIQRVRDFFTWTLYSDRLIKLTKLYGFWRYSVIGPEKSKLDRYCDLIYHFLYKARTM